SVGTMTQRGLEPLRLGEVHARRVQRAVERLSVVLHAARIPVVAGGTRDGLLPAGLATGTLQLPGERDARIVAGAVPDAFHRVQRVERDEERRTAPLEAHSILCQEA